MALARRKHAYRAKSPAGPDVLLVQRLAERMASSPTAPFLSLIGVG
jgi:hypothetical protein